ncbi:hypothetical protein QBC35DRAFT_552676 [Podospora australis]|uniref:Uncharacterized protein n=1 Tax=Podospora australis TaxID=1536484 RepID=A0AAN6X4Z8_9PEZI|nr:hypothetical protein QBC35DRAFT_552676 [Podospora australis]
MSSFRKEKKERIALDEDHVALDTRPGVSKRIDLPFEAFILEGKGVHPFAKRPPSGPSTATNIKVTVECKVTNPGGMSGVVYRKAWDSKTVKEELRDKFNKGPWIYDYRNLAWSTNNVEKKRITIDLGKEEGRTPGNERRIFFLTVTKTRQINLQALTQYLEGKMGWDNMVLESISFFDHVLREGPSKTMTLLKRTLFNAYSETHRLNNYTEAIKGIYSAIRLNSTISSTPKGSGLGVNVDVSNQTFFVGQAFEQLVRNMLATLNRDWANLDYDTMKRILEPVKVHSKDNTSFVWGQSEAFKALRRLNNLKFRVKHRGKTQDPKEYKVKRFMFDPAYGQGGANAKVVKFKVRTEKGDEGQVTTVFDYYATKYKTRLNHWQLPLLETNRAGMFPMEVCEVERFNPFPFKLDPSQTQEMIKFAVQRPPQRKIEILKMVQQLEWSKDRYLKHFGIRISEDMPMVEAKLIPNPVIQFGGKTLDPKMTGRWDLRGQKFVMPNTNQPLKSWAFVVVDGCVDKNAVETFSTLFTNTYKGHGGVVTVKPYITGFAKTFKHDLVIQEAYTQCGNHFKAIPQLLILILPDKTQYVYERFKKNGDCKLAVMTQMLQAQHVKKCQAQYCSNVCMKVNAKLGGQTSKIKGKIASQSAFFTQPTMMIGCDVGHGKTGEMDTSVAALTVSMDKDAAVYECGVQSNGRGVEIVQPANIHSILGPLIQKWKKKNGVPPKHVFYVRDGVSEGQYAHVIEWELEEMRRTFEEAIAFVPKITVIIATKRHHIRFFPEKGDKNGNPLPGTLVEKEVTHPFHYDFYLCSHVAIQGTARPVHYNVLHDEVGLKPEDLQRILYHQCYQYCRSTTPVSLHPAVYYAHLACERARAHHDEPTSKQVPEEVRYKILVRGNLAKHVDTITENPNDPVKKLMKIGAHAHRQDNVKWFTEAMWWV